MSQQAFSHPLAVRLHVPPLKWFFTRRSAAEPAVLSGLQSIETKARGTLRAQNNQRLYHHPGKQKPITRNRRARKKKVKELCVSRTKLICDSRWSIPRVGHASCDLIYCDNDHFAATFRRESLFIDRQRRITRNVFSLRV